MGAVQHHLAPVAELFAKPSADEAAAVNAGVAVVQQVKAHVRSAKADAKAVATQQTLTQTVQHILAGAPTLAPTTPAPTTPTLALMDAGEGRDGTQKP